MSRRGLRPPYARLALSATILLTLSCAANGFQVPAEPPYISGTITSVGRVAEGWTVRVEERPNEVSGSAKGVFRVGERTDVRRGSGARARADELREGQRVRVWVTGPVAESYPVQAAARSIVIDAEP